MTDETVAYMGWSLSAQEQIDGFRREVRELKAENALLWEQGALLFDKTLELGTENAKLRELVRDLYLCSDETCTDCEHHDYSGEGFWCKRGVGWKKARMRELGVVVE